MSKIKATLEKATGIESKRGEDFQTYAKRLVLGVQELSDKEWDGLPEDAQDWFNDAANAVNKKQDVKEFPDAEKDEEKPASRTRRRAADDEDEAKPEPKAAEPKVGDKVKIVNKRDKEFTGELVEFDDEVIVLKQDSDGEEVEFARDRVASVTVIADEPTKSKRRKAADDEDDEPAVVEPEVSDTVEVTNSRDKVSLGNIVEIDADVVVIKKADGEEVEFARDRIKSIVVKVKNAGKAADKTAKSETKPAKEKTETKRATREDNGGVSVGQRMRELIIDDLTAERDAISKALKKEGLEFKDNTLDLVYKEVHKIVAMLKAAKLMK